MWAGIAVGAAAAILAAAIVGFLLWRRRRVQMDKVTHSEYCQMDITSHAAFLRRPCCRVILAVWHFLEPFLLLSMSPHAAKLARNVTSIGVLAQGDDEGLSSLSGSYRAENATGTLNGIHAADLFHLDMVASFDRYACSCSSNSKSTADKMIAVWYCKPVCMKAIAALHPIPHCVTGKCGITTCMQADVSYGNPSAHCNQF